MLAGCASLLVVGCVGFGIASALTGASSAAAVSTAVISGSAASFSAVEDGSLAGLSEGIVLESAAQRDISQGIQEIADEEEAARLAAEEAARQDELEHIVAADTAKAIAYAKERPALSDVDFSCGKDEFIATWTQRINDYLAGSALAGYGADFAEAAWEYGVDPRWSPAIACTESSKGANCFASHNAWGWGHASWSSWSQAIDAHVKGLAADYGYTISWANAKKYCPPNYSAWYYHTLSEMAKL